ncbi:MAG: MBL fold metallo-hydrolase [Marinibacterium sp.]|nr:MBL fold metallo-hydrolase [Marinibacterium sp.]
MTQTPPTPLAPTLLAPGLRRILAPNPSPMTERGTNTYLLGQRDIVVIDPGPARDDHLDAILRAIGPDQRITAIVVTHSHLDHSPLARPLADRTGAQVLGFGPSGTGRSAIMSRLAESGLAGGGEGIDPDFAPDHRVADGDIITFDDQRLDVLHTPGHMGNHIALAWGDICFTGDLVMGWASSLVSPPDGDLTDFMASCRRLRGRDWSVFHAGHGDPITAPSERLDWLIAHRLTREAAILEALTDGPATAAELARRIYTDTPPALLPAAERNVLAHLIDLVGQSRTEPLETLSATARFRGL